MFAINEILVPRLASGTDPLVSTAYYTGFASIILWVFAFVFESPLRTHLKEQDIVAELIMGIFCFASGFVVYYWLVNRAGAFFSSMTFYLIPIVGAVGSIIILNEKMNLIQVLGILIVFVGVYLINRVKFEKG